MIQLRVWAIHLAVFMFFSLATAMNIPDVNVPSASVASHQNQNNNHNQRTSTSMIASNIAKSERRENGRSMESMPRTFCTKCKRPAKVCICPGLPSELIATETEVLVLQHPGEFRSRKTISTTPLIPLVLQHCTIRVGYSFDAPDLAPIREALARGQTPLLLFPGSDAISLDEGTATLNSSSSSFPANDAADNETTSASRHLLILVDGTWTQARRMIRESPSLMACCQKVEFTSPEKSIYDAIRKEPEKHCLSTLECCAQALIHLEPPPVAAAESDSDSSSSANNNTPNGVAAHALIRALTTLVQQQQQMRLDPVPRHLEIDDRITGKQRRRSEIERDML
jgi:DTW domain-containing protein YfiP